MNYSKKIDLKRIVRHTIINSVATYKLLLVYIEKVLYKQGSAAYECDLKISLEYLFGTDSSILQDEMMAGAFYFGILLRVYLNYIG